MIRIEFNNRFKNHVNYVNYADVAVVGVFINNHIVNSTMIMKSAFD